MTNDLKIALENYATLRFELMREGISLTPYSDSCDDNDVVSLLRSDLYLCTQPHIAAHLVAELVALGDQNGATETVKNKLADTMTRILFVMLADATPDAPEITPDEEGSYGPDFDAYSRLYARAACICPGEGEDLNEMLTLHHVRQYFVNMLHEIPQAERLAARILALLVTAEGGLTEGGESFREMLMS